jgi:glyoxylate reductase
MAVGYDNIDVAAATRLGIPVSNTPGVLTETTADLTWALLLAVARRVPEAHRYQVEGRYKLWGPNLFLGADVGPGATDRRKILGVVGFGRIGRAVARRAGGFEMEVLVHTRNRAAIASAPEARWVELDELLERSDFVTLHTPATQETRHLIGERELRRMKPTAYLINTSRGDVVDEAALVRALTEGDIAGAGLDVYEGEPAMAPGLTAAPGVVLLPHVGSATRGTRGRMATMAADNALAHLRGATAPHVVNPEVYGAAAYRRRRVGR